MSATTTPEPMPDDRNQTQDPSANLGPDGPNSSGEPEAGSATGSIPPPTSRAVRVSAVLCLVCIAVYAVGVYRTRGIIDDGAIHLRVVQQFRSGNGPVFNASERIEASSSPLWVAVLAIADLLLPLRLDVIALMFGGAFSIAGYAWMLNAGWERSIGDRGVPLPASALVVAALPGVWRWSTAGMEVGLALGWIGGVWLLTTRCLRRRELSAVAALAIGLGPLVRQEYVLCSAIIASAVVATSQAPRRDRLQFMAWVLAPGLSLQVLRMIYFGVLVPNPTIAKSVNGLRWSMGWDWLRSSLTDARIWAAAIGLLAVSVIAIIGSSDRRQALINAAFVSAGGAALIAPLAAGGDFMNMRLLVPVIFFVAAPAAVVNLRVPTELDVWRRASRRSLGATATVMVCLPIAIQLITRTEFWKPTPEYFLLTHTTRIDTSKVRELRGVNPGLSSHLPIGLYSDLDHRFHPEVPLDNTTVLATGIGFVAVTSTPNIFIYDRVGLANRTGAHLRPPPGRSSLPQGHEKPLPTSWIAAALEIDPTPTAFEAIDIPLVFSAATYSGTTAAGFADDTNSASNALRCPELADLGLASTGRLDLARAWHNLFGATERTFVSFSPDPRLAERQNCGS